MFEGRPLIIFTDHKTLTFAMHKVNSTTETPRRTRQLLFISEFTTDIRLVSRKQNIAADALSRIENITCPSAINYEEITTAQQQDTTIQQLLQENINLKKSLSRTPMSHCTVKLHHRKYGHTYLNNIDNKYLEPYITSATLERLRHGR
ncbi:unnamed protein product [Euphydryas editha]|uniref:Reverse transcriptase RNase H-like domain-containing protein n=1 Tax=Euphydryas editha TaxID=104508 RepID=A0AAU9VD10_EUPED|nr:unnamed protein product [Euphydryas editha]